MTETAFDVARRRGGGRGGFVGAQSLNRTDYLRSELREYIPAMLASSGLSFVVTAFGTMGWVNWGSSPDGVAVGDSGGDPLGMPHEAGQPDPVFCFPRLRLRGWQASFVLFVSVLRPIRTAAHHIYEMCIAVCGRAGVHVTRAHSEQGIGLIPTQWFCGLWY